LYEIFVPRELRSRGIGSRLRGEVENIAKRLRYERITLTAWPLEDGFSEAKLVRWYKKRGYKKRPDFPDELEKRVS
jgi:GNAT superfamily N-acetyltransferase